ncbi:phospholipase [Xenophilus azovorans]|jgi:hypothetical protein|uniref:phospholipase n=1 Tax=Comamonadaceae TaxID=80864 RepID=UPI000A7E2D93|nr:phospholipase [Xenophilus azovorans]
MYYIEQIRENTLSDILGWVRPDQVPPVNGRTYKELKMLGFDLEGGILDEIEDDGP